MTVSALRTIVVGAPASAYGVCQPSLRWPMAEPDEVLDYSLDVSALLSDAGDTIVSATLAVAPTGIDEMSPGALNVAGGVITAWLAGGVAGRAYTVRIEATTAGDRMFEWLVRLSVDPSLASWPMLPAPSEDFGDPVAWPDRSSALNFSSLNNSAFLLLL